MDYLFLLQTDGAACKGSVDEQAMEAIKMHWSIMDEATEKGVFKGASPLYGIDTARTFRSGSQGISVTDGPHAETKEYLAGYYCISCANQDEADYWARRLAAVPGLLSVETRAMMPIPSRVEAEAVAAQGA